MLLLYFVHVPWDCSNLQIVDIFLKHAIFVQCLTKKGSVFRYCCRVYCWCKFLYTAVKSDKLFLINIIILVLFYWLWWSMFLQYQSMARFSGEITVVCIQCGIVVADKCLAEKDRRHDYQRQLYTIQIQLVCSKIVQWPSNRFCLTEQYTRLFQEFKRCKLPILILIYL